MCPLFRFFHICSNWNTIHEEIGKLKEILIRNRYPISLIGFCIKKFLDKPFCKNDKEITIPEKEIRVVLPFVDKEINSVKKKISKLVSETFPFCKVIFVFQTGRALSGLYTVDYIQWSAYSGVHTVECIVDYMQWTAYSGLHTVDIQWTAYSGLHTVDCIQWTAYSGLHTVDCIQWTAYSGLHTVDCIQWTAYSGLHTVDYIQWTTHSESWCFLNTRQLSDARKYMLIVFV